MSLMEKELYEFGIFLLDPTERTLSCQGTPVSLTPKAFATLLCLVHNQGRTVTKDELLRQIWPGIFVEEVNLAVNISTIRKALGENPQDVRFIATVPGRGYRFVADVRKIASQGENGSNAIAESDPEPIEITSAAGRSANGIKANHNMSTAFNSQIQISPSDGYVFANTDEYASTLFDAHTIRHLTQLGVSKGWTCLEVGGGGGSIASWLCEHVGEVGGVLATDIDPRFLRALRYPNLGVRRHDIRTEGLPEHQFDLAHARMVLMHLPERELALQRMLKALKPGGWIVIEEMDDLSIVPDGSVNPAEEELKVRRAFQHVLARRGVELRYGRLLPQKLRAQGFVNVGAEASVSIWNGRSAGTRLLKLTCQQLRDPIIGSGLISQSEFDAEMKRVDEPDFLMPSPMLWTVWGQVPQEATIGQVESIVYEI
jgi:DNA-binding winged helix-turn-helix (wHTH) protein/2-polyprenyl-3-methyl-5-hydroxy-6-metoxy-1,4-benzoquinol methylase